MKIIYKEVDMQEKIEIEVSKPDGENGKLEFVCDLDADVMDIVVDGEMVCSGDWTDNFKVALERALQIWK